MKSLIENCYRQRRTLSCKRGGDRLQSAALIRCSYENNRQRRHNPVSTAEVTLSLMCVQLYKTQVCDIALLQQAQGLSSQLTRHKVYGLRHQITTSSWRPRSLKLMQLLISNTLEYSLLQKCFLHTLMCL